MDSQLTNKKRSQMTGLFVHWSGFGLILGAVILGIAIVLISLHPSTNQPISPTLSLLLLLASIFLLLSLPIMYTKQATAVGWLGSVGYILLQTGILLLAVIASPPLLFPTLNLAPGENIVVFLLGIALTLGLLLTGIVTLRAGVFPRWSGILLLAATIGFFFDFFVAEFLPPVAGQVGSAFFGVMLALSLAWIGLYL